MKKFRKLFAAVIVLCLSFSAFSVNAETVEKTYYYKKVLYLSDGSIAANESTQEEQMAKVAADVADIVKDSGIYGYIAENFRKQTASIDVSMYNLSWDDAEKVFSVIKYVLYEYPDINFVDDKWILNGKYIGNKAIVSSVAPIYSITGSEYEQMRRNYETAMQEITDGIPENLSDLEKVMFVHNYIADNYEYDTSAGENVIYDVYNMLSEKKGVCQAYSYLFMLIMQRLGIDCTYAVSTEANHMWNIVEIDGQYYNLDVTWDDPVGSKPLVRYDYFLLSMPTLLKLCENRSSWGSYRGLTTADISDTSFESGYIWNGNTSEHSTIYLNGYWYRLEWYTSNKETGYFNSGNNPIYFIQPIISRADSTLKNEVEVASFEPLLWEKGNQYWEKVFSGFFSVGNTICGNINDTLWTLETNTLSPKLNLITDDAVKAPNETVYFNSYTDGDGNIIIETDLNSVKENQIKIPFPIIAKNGNSWAQALVQTRKSLLDEPQPEVNTDFLDMNGDNIIDIRDLVKMKKRSAAAAA